LKLRSRVRNWKLVTCEEMYVTLELFIADGHYREIHTKIFFQMPSGDSHILINSDIKRTGNYNRVSACS
jgi:hypothetical protein